MMNYKHTILLHFRQLRSTLLEIPSCSQSYSLTFDSLPLSVRAENVLKTLNIITIGDFINVDEIVLMKTNGLGLKTIREICNLIKSIALGLPKSIYLEEDHSAGRANIAAEITAYNAEAITTQSHEAVINEPAVRHRQADIALPVNLEDAIKSLLERIPDKYRHVFIRRYAVNDRSKLTLEAVGKDIGITKQRVGQILLKAQTITHKRSAHILNIIIDKIDNCLEQNGGVISISEIASSDFFNCSDNKSLRLILNYLVDTSKQRYSFIDKYFLTNMQEDGLKELAFIITDYLSDIKYPIPEDAFIASMKAKLGGLSHDYLSYFLLSVNKIILKDGQVLSPGKLSIPDKLKLIMMEIEKPIHYSQITSLFNSRFTSMSDICDKTDRNILEVLHRTEIFMLTDLGTFILKTNFKYPDNLDAILNYTKNILIELNGQVTDSRYLMHKLSSMGVDTGLLNPYSLKEILIDQDWIVSHKKFEVSLKSDDSKLTRHSAAELIHNVFKKHKGPLTSSYIWNAISKHRGYPKYIIDQILSRDSDFIRVAPAQYIDRYDIHSYNGQCHIIRHYTAELISSSSSSVSLTQITDYLHNIFKEVLFDTELVKKVLSSDSSFVERYPEEYIYSRSSINTVSLNYSDTTAILKLGHNYRRISI